jgi:hypothetical protein
MLEENHHRDYVYKKALKGNVRFGFFPDATGKPFENRAEIFVVAEIVT